MTPLHPKLGQVYRKVCLSAEIEKTASARGKNDSINAELSHAKIALDADIFDTIRKTAGWFQEAMKSPIGKGLAIGTGIAVPTGAAGAYLLNKARDNAEDATADVRNKILQTALGLGGIGAGMYGLHRLTGGGPLFESPESSESGVAKTSSTSDSLPEDILAKFATIAAIECAMENVDQTDREAVKLANEVRALNRAYCTNLLYEISHA